MAKDRYWFEHDSNAHADPEIKYLRMEHGWGAYGAFWAIIEMLRDTENYQIDLSLIEAICFDLRIEKEWIDTMFERGLLKTDGEAFWSATLRSRMRKWDEKKRVKAEAGRKGGIAKSRNRKKNSSALAAPKQKPGTAKAKPKQSPSAALARTEQNRTEQENIYSARTRDPEQKRIEDQSEDQPKDPTSKQICELAKEIAGEHWDPMTGPAMVQIARSSYFTPDVDTDAVIKQIRNDLAMRSDIHIGCWADVSRFLNGKFRDYSRRFKVKKESAGGAGDASYEAMKGIVLCIERKLGIDPHKLVLAWNTYREDKINIPLPVRQLIDKAESAGWIETVGRIGKIAALPCFAMPMTAERLWAPPSSGATADEVAAALAGYRGEKEKQ